MERAALWLRPAFARRVCFSLSSFILAVRTFRPRGDADSCSGSVSPCFPEDVAAFQCFEVLSDRKKRKREKEFFCLRQRESIFAGLCR